MRFAINLAKRNAGFTGLNPSVGAVIVKNNKIISFGITALNGRPHGENIAINKSREDISGSTMYVTLEPCCHFGKTDPCVDSIINKKIARVVIASLDPDPRVNGKGARKLQENGIQVEIGLLESEAQKINCGFFKAKLEHKPFVTLKLATSLDGKIALRNFDSKCITNERARLYGHYLRAKNDAILIGANTLKKDNPMLDCRINGLEKFSPIRIILSNTLNLDLDYKIFKTAEQIKTFVATQGTNTRNAEHLLKAGIKIINFSNLKDLLEKICLLGVNNLLIEGGSRVAASFLAKNLIDKIIHIQSNKILGNDTISAVGELNITSLEESPNFKITKRKIFDDNQVTILSKNENGKQ